MHWFNWCKKDYDSNPPSDLGHIQGRGHFLQLSLHCAVAERPFQHWLFDPQQLTHLLQICNHRHKDGDIKQPDSARKWKSFSPCYHYLYSILLLKPNVKPVEQLNGNDTDVNLFYLILMENVVLL